MIWQAPTKDIALAPMQSKADLAPKAAMTLMAVLECMTSFPSELVGRQTRRMSTKPASTASRFSHVPLRCIIYYIIPGRREFLQKDWPQARLLSLWSNIMLFNGEECMLRLRPLPRGTPKNAAYVLQHSPTHTETCCLPNAFDNCHMRCI